MLLVCLPISYYFNMVRWQFQFSHGAIHIPTCIDSGTALSSRPSLFTAFWIPKCPCWRNPNTNRHLQWHVLPNSGRYIHSHSLVLLSAAQTLLPSASYLCRENHCTVNSADFAFHCLGLKLLQVWSLKFDSVWSSRKMPYFEMARNPHVPYILNLEKVNSAYIHRKIDVSEG